MKKLVPVLVSLLLPVALAACGGIPGYYRTPIVQGNVMPPAKVAKIEFGMTRQQVKYLLGTPLVDPAFESDRLTYVSYYRTPEGEVSKSRLILYFSDNALERVAGSREFTSLIKDTADDIKA